jgi:hypothetical protein
MGDQNEDKFFSCRCRYCKDQIVVKAKDEGSAEFMWQEFRPCGCQSGVQIMPQEMSDDSQRCVYTEVPSW